ncbi:DUF3408 domain-containing protein [Myroides odoratimimus]|uniref:DUF3408 domain-containing protein n=1 Tax=Myroides odoratimimus TaxID=76832 RepID=UPI0025767394|nr:DUF3408 domain-containing protein [Myroides odoratimimus]MDM1507624.1 DUF3408 domain-containing protein [Myroides odoratimimus]MDM1508334.1 DUF3408 domain-containing protein [Myroides odoratimimus]
MKKIKHFRKSAQLQKAKSKENYVDTFLKETSTRARDGKTVYIRPEFHKKLTRIVQVIGEDKVSIYTYLDNLLDNHFEEFSQTIVEKFNEKYKPIF